MSPDKQFNSDEAIGFSHSGNGNGKSTKGGSLSSSGDSRSDDKPCEVPQNEVARGRSMGVTNNSLSPLEERMIACFVEISSGFHLPRSVGEIFGLIYASPEPVPFEGVMQRLQLSKASTSTGLKFLQRLGALRTVYVAGDRRTFYEPEMSFRQLLSGLMNETLLPHLRKSNGHIEAMRQLLPAASQQGHGVLSERVEQLTRWQGKADKLMPLLLNLGRLT